MASTSTSSVQKSFMYDAFLSFRGEDTRNNFVSNLYKALEQNGIQTYKDDKKIEKGETIDTQLMESIEDSRFFIILFSKDYAGSSWCLDELVKIMQCQKASEQTAYPVFYDVEPREIRNQSGAVGEAFKNHENDEAATKWRDALNEAGKLAGWESKKTANGDESKLIQIIVDDIFKKICSSSPSDDSKLVGMETRIEALLSSLELDAPGVRMIGIWGMGGGGKTTLATTIFNQISHQFDGSSFVDNVREVSNFFGLKELQKRILNDIFSDQYITVSSVSGGKNKMVQMMRRKKVLVVLDDVDSTEQLEALAGEPDWFKSGSRVIITTRDKQVLLAHGVKFIDVNLLSRAEAICLLSKYAFKRDIPFEGYEELSEEVVKYAAGLPLTIRVLGSLLYGQNVPQWMDTLERLKKIPLKATMDKLELSYIGLEEDHKEIFLDVACLLKGWVKDCAIKALESCGFRAQIGLRVLELKSLITISEGGYLGMYNHIEEMGKNIVRRTNPGNPERHSRLWIKEEIVDILANNKGTQATQCMRLDASEIHYGILMNGLANMKELRFLHVHTKFLSKGKVCKWNFDEDSLHLPNALRFLRWDNYPFSSLPKTFQANNLVGLEMDDSKMVQLWKDGEEKVTPNLEELFIEFCARLEKLHLGVTPNLQTLILRDCADLVELQIPAECPKLVNLDLRKLKLRTLHLGVTPKLETVSLKDFRDLVELHIPAECPMLVTLDFCDLWKLRTLHLGVTPNLQTLILRDCADLVELQIPAECPKLVNLDLRKLKLRTLHLGVTPKLETVSLKDFRDLVELQIPAECPMLVTLDFCDLWKLRTLHLGVTPNLQTLILRDCADLVELQIPAECPKLVNLDLRKLKLRTLHLGVTPKLETVSLKDFCDLVELQIPAECPMLVTLNFCNLWKLRTLHLGVTPNLETLRVSDCADLVELQIPAECPKLVNLDLGYCIVVKELPKEIGRLECLKELDITDTRIRHLPESIFRMKGLRIVGSRQLLESCGFTSEIKTFDFNKTFCYI